MPRGQHKIERKSFLSISVFGSDGVHYVHRRPGEDCLTECLTPTMKHPLSVMIWGCIFRKGVGTIQVLEENRPIHSSRYIKEVQMRLSAPDLFGAIVATSHFSGMEHHATQLVSISDGSSNTMSNCLLGLETVHTSTLLRICGHD